MHWKLRDMLQPAPARTYVHLLLGAPGRDQEQFSLPTPGLHPTEVSQLSAPAKLLRLQLCDDFGAPQWRLVHPVSDKTQQRQFITEAISSPGSVGMFLNDCTDTTLLANIHNIVDVVCQPHACFPRIQEATTHVDVLLLDTPDPRTMVAPRFTALHKDADDPYEVEGSDVNDDNELIKLLTLVGAHCICVVTYHCEPQRMQRRVADDATGAGAASRSGCRPQHIILNAGDTVFGVVYDALPPYSGGISVAHILSERGLATWSLSPYTGITRCSRVDKTPAQADASLCSLQEFRTARRIAVRQLQ